MSGIRAGKCPNCGATPTWTNQFNGITFYPCGMTRLKDRRFSLMKYCTYPSRLKKKGKTEAMKTMEVVAELEAAISEEEARDNAELEGRKP